MANEQAVPLLSDFNAQDEASSSRDDLQQTERERNALVRAFQFLKSFTGDRWPYNSIAPDTSESENVAPALPRNLTDLESGTNREPREVALEQTGASRLVRPVEPRKISEFFSDASSYLSAIPAFATTIFFAITLLDLDALKDSSGNNLPLSENKAAQKALKITLISAAITIVLVGVTIGIPEINRRRYQGYLKKLRAYQEANPIAEGVDVIPLARMIRKNIKSTFEDAIAAHSTVPQVEYALDKYCGDMSDSAKTDIVNCFKSLDKKNQEAKNKSTNSQSTAAGTSHSHGMLNNVEAGDYTRIICSGTFSNLMELLKEHNSKLTLNTSLLLKQTFNCIAEQQGPEAKLNMITHVLDMAPALLITSAIDLESAVKVIRDTAYQYKQPKTVDLSQLFTKHLSQFDGESGNFPIHLASKEDWISKLRNTYPQLFIKATKDVRQSLNAKNLTQSSTSQSTGVLDLKKETNRHEAEIIQYLTEKFCKGQIACDSVDNPVDLVLDLSVLGKSSTSLTVQFNGKHHDDVYVLEADQTNSSQSATEKKFIAFTDKQLQKMLVPTAEMTPGMLLHISMTFADKHIYTATMDKGKSVAPRPPRI